MVVGASESVAVSASVTVSHFSRWDAAMSYQGHYCAKKGDGPQELRRYQKEKDLDRTPREA